MTLKEKFVMGLAYKKKKILAASLAVLGVYQLGIHNAQIKNVANEISGNQIPAASVAPASPANPANTDNIVNALSAGQKSINSYHGNSQIESQKDDENYKITVMAPNAHYMNQKIVVADKNDPSNEVFFLLRPGSNVLQAGTNEKVLGDPALMERMMDMATAVAFKRKMSLSEPAFYSEKHGIKYVDVSKMTGVHNQIVAVTPKKLKELEATGDKRYHVLSDAEVIRRHATIDNDLSSAKLTADKVSRVYKIAEGNEKLQEQISTLEHKYNNYKQAHPESKLPSLNYTP